jgi:uncharacterized Zn finger protein
MAAHSSLIDQLASMTGGSLQARGRDYAEAGLVSNVRRRGGRVRATVHGTYDYAVTLDTERGECDCPHAMDGNICKHMVAVALVAAELVGGDDDGSGSGQRLSTYLRSLSQAELVDLLLDAALQDETLEKRLLLAAAAAKGDLQSLRSQVDAMLGGRGMLYYRDAIDYAHEAADLVAALDRASAGATDARVVPIIEHALDQVAEALAEADDSAGCIGALSHDLLAVHASACARTSPDPVKLAQWLVRLTVDQQDLVTVEVGAYASALGVAGLAAYRTEINRRLRADPDRYALRHAAERLAVLDRDTDAVIRLFGGDLATTYDHVRLVQALIEIERYDDALAWARRGMDLPATWQSSPLFDLAAAIHAERGEPVDVLSVRECGLAAFPDEQSYAALREAAQRLGTWTEVRPRALAVLAKRSPRAHVEALVSDDDIETAWAAATAGKGHSAVPITQQLASRRAATHPAEAIPHYRRFAEEALGGANRGAYRTAAGWLVGLRDLHTRVGTADAFAAYLTGLREAHRRRRAFLEELRRAGL